ncbi:hypothetical protein VPH35_082860 [Triticum aestivum]
MKFMCSSFLSRGQLPFLLLAITFSHGCSSPSCANFVIFGQFFCNSVNFAIGRTNVFLFCFIVFACSSLVVCLQLTGTWGVQLYYLWRYVLCTAPMRIEELQFGFQSSEVQCRQ